MRARRYVAVLVLIGAAYDALARSGEALVLTGPVAAFWPATGFGIAVLYLGGLRWWPGVLIGNLLSCQVGLIGTGPALAESAGNVASAVVATVILLRLIGPRAGMDRLSHVGAVLVAIATGEAISATVATLALLAGDNIGASLMTMFWRSRWLGGLAGGLVVIPLAMAWARPRAAVWRVRLLEALLMVISVIGLSAIALSAEPPSTYLVSAALIWAALRFGPQGATLAVAVAVVEAVVVTSEELGPFHAQAAADSALNLQLYMVFAALTTLCLAALVSERHRAAREVVESQARLAEAGDRERRKIERDLHDGAQQRLMAIQVKLRLAREHADGALAAQLDAIGVEAEEAVEELRTLAHGIYPPVLQAYGLADAVRSYALRASIPIAVDDEGVGRCSSAVETAIYFCTTEAVQNAIKHAGRNAGVTISLGRDRERVHFAIADDGVGMDMAVRGEGDGLLGMRDRIGAVNGALEIISAPGCGTTVMGAVPLRQSETAVEPHPRCNGW